MKENAYYFWKRLDENYKGSLKDLCLKTGVDYNRIKRNRSDCRLPNLQDAYAISHLLGIDIEYLLTGENSTAVYSARVKAIADACTKASDLELAMVEKILDIPPLGKNTDVQKALS